MSVHICKLYLESAPLATLTNVSTSTKASPCTQIVGWCDRVGPDSGTITCQAQTLSLVSSGFVMSMPVTIVSIQLLSLRSSTTPLHVWNLWGACQPPLSMSNHFEICRSSSNSTRDIYKRFNNNKALPCTDTAGLVLGESQLRNDYLLNTNSRFGWFRFCDE